MVSFKLSGCRPIASFAMAVLFFLPLGCGKFNEKFGRFSDERMTEVNLGGPGRSPLLAAQSGGVMIYAINLSSGFRAAFKFADENERRTVALPVGRYIFLGLGWDGADPLTGQARCAEEPETVLDGKPRSITIVLSSSKCNFGQSSIFGPASASTASNFRSLTVRTCIGTSNLVAGCVFPNFITAGGSVRLSLLGYKKNPGDAPLVAVENEYLNSNCSTIAAATHTTTMPISLPIGGGNFGGGLFAVKVQVFEGGDTSCSGTPAKEFLLPSGIVGGLSAPGYLASGRPSVPNSSGMNIPRSLSTDGTRLVVADTMNHRVLIWNNLTPKNGAPADLVLGQPNFSSNSSNNGGIGASTLNLPSAVAISPSGKLFIADAGNNRVLVWNTFPTSNMQAADVVIGQPDFTSTATGAAMNQLNNIGGISLSDDGAKLFVADTGNHRVQYFSAVPTSNDQSADYYLGVSGTSGSGPNQFNSPSWVSVCGTKVYTVDSANHRVQVHNSFPTANSPNADLTLGTGTSGLSQILLNVPKSVSCDGSRLAVSDGGTNRRVLLWTSLPTSNAQPADIVIGQGNFTTNVTGSGALLTGRSLAATTYVHIRDGRVYVSDSTNSRVLGWTSIPAENHKAANFVLGQLDFSTTATSQTNANPPNFLHLQLP